MSPLQNADLSRELAKTNNHIGEMNQPPFVVNRAQKRFSYTGLDLDPYQPGKDESLEHQIEQCQKQI